MAQAEWVDLDLDAGVLNVTKQWTKAGELGPVKTKSKRAVVIGIAASIAHLPPAGP